MIMNETMRRALERLSLLRFFPANSQEALLWVAETLRAMCRDDADIQRVVESVLGSESEWPGPGDFQRKVAQALWPFGMWKRNGKWVPAPENGPQHDIVGADGSRYWVKGAFYRYPVKP